MVVEEVFRAVPYGVAPVSDRVRHVGGDFGLYRRSAQRLPLVTSRHELANALDKYLVRILETGRASWSLTWHP